jgi:GDP/UDP-N,N'-diacetylbacillosamine 2-epimerase (hydrolysing)
MISIKKICVITGSRAEYGLLKNLMLEIKSTLEYELQVVATGMHLSLEFGLTYKKIEEEGFKINEKVEMLLSSDTSSSISKSTGLGLVCFSDCFNRLNPDLIVVLGDRYEILAASIAGLFAKIPIAHIHGGETTQGAFDEAIRHSITKISWLHFVAADEYAKRVIQLGEDPKRVFNVGGLGVDLIKKEKLLSKKDLENKTGIKFGNRNLLITYHPETLGIENSRTAFKLILETLADLRDVYLIFTMPNADSDGRIIIKMINEFVSLHNQSSIAFASLGSLNYLSTLQFIDGVVGNSSSGLTEAPSFNVGTVNIGYRQKGRLRAISVIDCELNKKSIKQGIKKLFSNNFKKRLKDNKNPYGQGDAAVKIINILKSYSFPDNLKKEFYDL